MSNRSKTLVWTAVEWPFWKARMADSWPLNPTFSKSQRFVTRIALLSNGFSPIESKINENKKERTAEPNRPVLRLATKVDSIWRIIEMSTAQLTVPIVLVVIRLRAVNIDLSSIGLILYLFRQVARYPYAVYADMPVRL